LTRWTPTNCVNSSPRCRNVTFGVLFRDNGYIRNPHRLVRALAEAFLRDGGEIIQDEAIGFVLEGGAYAVSGRPRPSFRRQALSSPPAHTR
jgi:hypothetical protein